MTYKDLLYPPLERISVKVLTKLDPENYEQLESVDSINQKLQEAYAETDATCLAEVHELTTLDVLSSIDLPEWQHFKSLLIFALAIEQEEDIDLEEDFNFDTQKFKLIDINQTFPFNASILLNPNDFYDSIAYLNFRSIESIRDEICHSFDLLTVLVHHIGNIEEFNNQQSIVLCRQETENYNFAVAAIKVMALMEGKSLHQEKTAQLSAQNHLVSRLSPLKAFNQFDETIIILSELNAHSGLLSKFLSLYHVIENFMFKIPLVELGKRNSQRFFSIRDFRRLYKATSDNELRSIEDFFKIGNNSSNWQRDIDGTSFSSLIEQNLNAVEAICNPDLSVLDEFIQKLCFNRSITTFIEFKQQINPKSYADFLYQVRCSIVHNKETEHHISHFNLDEKIAVMIDKILLQPLHCLIYELITDSTSPVWYEEQRLELY